MDDLDRRKRQHDPPVHGSSGQRYPLQDSPHHGRAVAAVGQDRYRPMPLNTSPGAARGMGASVNYSTYYQEPSTALAPNMPAAAMAYGTDYGQDARQQTQNFGGYSAATMMYNVPQPATQTPVYDAQSYGSRQSASMQMMAPDVTSTYFGADAANASAASLPQAHSSGAPTTVYQQTPAMSFASSMSNVNTMQQSPGNADAPMAEDQDYADNALEEKWVNYQRQLGTIFQDIGNGSLNSASETLLSISSWLLPQVVDLGLSLDDANLHADRIKLWNDFNHAWLALGYRQKQLMQPGQQPSTSHSLMSQEQVLKMGNELIRLCDGLERHGLIDYQYGVWEEQIESVLEDCLDLYDIAEDADTSGVVQ